jgi:hypothetical protein
MPKSLDTINIIYAFMDYNNDFFYFNFSYDAKENLGNAFLF